MSYKLQFLTPWQNDPWEWSILATAQTASDPVTAERMLGVAVIARAVNDALRDNKIQNAYMCGHSRRCRSEAVQWLLDDFEEGEPDPLSFQFWASIVSEEPLFLKEAVRKVLEKNGINSQQIAQKSESKRSLSIRIRTLTGKNYA